MSLRFIASSALLTVLGALVPACSDSSTFNDGVCTEIGCGSAFSVAFQHPGTWQPGVYTVDVMLDGTKVTCSATMPLKCDAPSPCPDGSKVLLGLSGCALPEAQQSLGDIVIEQGASPKSVVVEVSLDGASLHQQSFDALSYTTSQPNGPKCEPTCMTAAGATFVFP